MGEDAVVQRAQLPFVKEGSLDLNLIDGRQRILIGYHAGCPDGAVAAYMLSATLRKLHPCAAVTAVPIGHSMHKFASAIEPGMLVSRWTPRRLRRTWKLSTGPMP